MRTADFMAPILEARKRRKRPAGMVIVSDGDYGLHREFSESHVVRVRPDVRPGALEWSPLAGLNVEIVTLAADPRRLVELVQAVVAVRPEYLRVWHLPSDGLVRIRWLGCNHVRRESGWICDMPGNGSAPDELVALLAKHIRTECKP